MLICGKDTKITSWWVKKHWFDDRGGEDALQKIVRVQEAGIDTFNIPWGRSGRYERRPGRVFKACTP